MKKIWQKIKYDLKYSGYRQGYGSSDQEIPGLFTVQMGIVGFFVLVIIVGLIR